MSVASTERAALIQLLDQLGPDAPTLCDGWQTRDLAAHIAIRERRLDAAPGIVVSFLSNYTGKVMREYAAKPWPELLRLLREGPPAWSPMGLSAVSDRVDLPEFFVHHEDVRRGAPGWEPRPPDPDRDRALWKLLGTSGRMMYRRSPVGVVLRRRSDGAEHAIKTGATPVILVGDPAELVLHAYGRSAVEVDVLGDPAAVQLFERSPRGI